MISVVAQAALHISFSPTDLDTAPAFDAASFLPITVFGTSAKQRDWKTLIQYEKLLKKLPDILDSYSSDNELICHN